MLSSATMGWKVQIVLCIAFLSGVSASNSDDNSIFNGTIRSFAGTKCGSSACNNSQHRRQNSGSEYRLNESLYIKSVKFEDAEKAIHVNISKIAGQYLTGPWMTIFIPSVYTAVIAMSLPLNCLAILLFLFKLKLKTPSIIFMVNLAIADLLFVLLLPLKISYHFSGNDWGFGSFTCRMVTGGFYAYMYCSVLLMMCISVDRFFAVVYPIRSVSWRSPKRASVLCIVMWVLAITGALPLFLSEQMVYISKLNITTCHDVLPLSTLQNHSLYYFPILCTLFFVLPLIVTSICYISIILTLSSSSLSTKCKKTRAISLAVLVLFVFIVCFAPTNILLLIHYLHFYHSASDSIYFAYLLCLCIGSVSSCIDPLIYYYASSLCQKHLQNLQCCGQATESGSSRMECLNDKLGTTSPIGDIHKQLLT
ncbi:proteinase-activated receptor 1-like [Callorhinchus milii]|uniref:Proteinase-activated receptor 1 n=1 Tax=Callorhinchus milii TaxID=7868 RepID=A0A4W3GFI0_CALMI|nr:proteinase-activated receptor 1-like [Callorhinchus milii]|eukprot:gi/632974247/ref/XP_007903567.1/ PREDICTED: proteinase-activated receptor 1-like [Callorhinchus milii]